MKRNIEKLKAWKQRSAQRLRPGKRTKEWARIRAILKPRFERAGITECEFGFVGCWHDNGLGFAHIDKRRNLSLEELWIVALACNLCHDILEIMPRKEMRPLILNIIVSRKQQP
jgi:hypothetical protein